MNTILVIASILGLSTATSVGIYGGKEESLSLDSFGGGGGGQDWASIGGSSGGLSGLSLGGGGGGHAELSFGGGSSSYSGPSSYETSSSQGSSGGGDNGDYHHGVSIIGGGGDGKSASFDLTNHGGGGGHSGPFGGSFVASAKYEGQSGIAHKVSDGDSLGGLITFGSPHYTDVLSASEGSSGGGGSYKWGVENGY